MSNTKQLSLRLNSAGVVLFSFVLETFGPVAMTESEDQCRFAREDLYLASGGTGRLNRTSATYSLLFVPHYVCIYW